MQGTANQYDAMIAEIRAEIRAELGRQDLNQTDLADLLRVPRGWVSDRLRGTAQLRVRDLLRIADALNVSVGRFLPTAAGERAA